MPIIYKDLCSKNQMWNDTQIPRRNDRISSRDVENIVRVTVMYLLHLRILCSNEKNLDCHKRFQKKLVRQGEVWSSDQ